MLTIEVERVHYKLTVFLLTIYRRTGCTIDVRYFYCWFFSNNAEMIQLWDFGSISTMIKLMHNLWIIPKLWDILRAFPWMYNSNCFGWWHWLHCRYLELHYGGWDAVLSMWKMTLYVPCTGQRWSGLCREEPLILFTHAHYAISLTIFQVTWRRSGLLRLIST